MVEVKGLIWDEWNRRHIAKHGVTASEVEDVCHGTHKEKVSFRKCLQLMGKTKKGRQLTIIISPENRELKTYNKGIYYPITAFEEVTE